MCGSARSAGWPESARPPSQCTRLTGWRTISPTASFTCRCTPTRVAKLLGQAEALNRLGELATRTADTPRAREHHTRALAIARDISAAPEEARALEGLGRAHIHGGNHGKGLDCLRQALTIYQRIKSPSAQRVNETLRQYALKPASPPSKQ